MDSKSITYLNTTTYTKIGLRSLKDTELFVSSDLEKNSFTKMNFDDSGNSGESDHLPNKNWKKSTYFNVVFSYSRVIKWKFKVYVYPKLITCMFRLAENT